MALCICASLNVNKLNVMHILSYIGYSITHSISVNMLAKHVSACEAKFIMNGLGNVIDFPTLS